MLRYVVLRYVLLCDLRGPEKSCYLTLCHVLPLDLLGQEKSSYVTLCYVLPFDLLGPEDVVLPEDAPRERVRSIELLADKPAGGVPMGFPSGRSGVSMGSP